ncbi:hypothetical protein Tco_0145326 [Tanacetum coccineum]
MSAPSLPDSHIDHHPLIASQDVVLDRIKSFPRGTSCGRNGLRAQHLMDCLSGAAVAVSDELVSSITQVVNLFLEGKCPSVLGGYIASAPLTPLVKPGGGIRPIAVGTIWRRLVSKVSATMIGHSLDGYLDGLQFGVGVPGGGEAILHAVNRLVEDRGDDVGLSMLLSSATLALPDYTTESTPCGHATGCSRAWYLDDGTIVGDTFVVGKVLELITEDGPRCGLHLNVDKTELFWPKEDPRSKLEGIFPPNISRPLHGVKLLGGPVSLDVDFGSALVMKRVSKTIGSGRAFICTASGPGFGDWQWRIATLPFAFGGLGIYSAGDVLNYAFIASRLQSATLQTKACFEMLTDGPVVAISREDQLQSGLASPYFLSQSLVQLVQGFLLEIFTGILLFHVRAEIIGIKHRYNMVRDSLCRHLSVRKLIWAGWGIGTNISSRDMLLYSWDGGLDVCVDLTGSSPLTQTRMTDFVPSRVVTDAAHRKCSKYITKCEAIGYGFLPFSFSSLGELKKDVVTLLKRVENFSMAQDIGARAASHIVNRIGFSIAKGVRTQIVSRLSSNVL